MKILALSDEKVKYFYDYYQPGRLKEYDLILACGDLPKNYLEFIVTMANCPVLYVHGNHDDRLLTVHRKAVPVLMESCLSIKESVFLAWAVPIDTTMESICIQKRR